jgi:hypothetical protein
MQIISFSSPIHKNVCFKILQMQENFDLFIDSLINICKKYETWANNSHILQLIYYHYTFVVGIKKNCPCFFKHRLVWHVLLTTYYNIVLKIYINVGHI